MRHRIKQAWHSLTDGRVIGNVGWCGQYGYWWTRPCPHYRHEMWGCGWLHNDEKGLRSLSYDEVHGAALDGGAT